MKLPFNLDFSERLVIKTADVPWGSDPVEGIERIPLEREHPEAGRSTSLVRYSPGSQFTAYKHELGEEIYVLDGEFCDEFGVYTPGTYLRNPAGSTHRFESQTGCVLFVKLGHFSVQDHSRVCVNTHASSWLPGHGRLQVMPLHQFGTEGTALVKWPAGERFLPHRHWGGEEILVLSGEFCDEYGSYPKGTWIRGPHLSAHHPYVHEETIILVKTGHLPH